jgi:hypothetical protein
MRSGCKNGRAGSAAFAMVAARIVTAKSRLKYRFIIIDPLAEAYGAVLIAPFKVKSEVI